MNKKIVIKIPEGCFRGNCVDCRGANWSDTRSDGSVYCLHYDEYIKPRNRCFFPRR